MDNLNELLSVVNFSGIAMFFVFIVYRFAKIEVSLKKIELELQNIINDKNNNK